MNVARLAFMMYELVEENVLDVEKSIKESTSNILEADSVDEKSSEESDTEQFINLIVIMKRIKTAYFENEILQQLMNVKRIDKRKISSALYKKNIRLKLSHCKIQDDLFWVKNRMYVSTNEALQIDIIKITHESKSIDHAERSTTYNKINRHYYWFKMYVSIQQYIKTCHACKRIKHYRDAKQRLLNSLSISKNYFQNISIDFITSLSICKRHELNYEHIMIVIDRLFKKKRFIFLHSLNVNTIVQAFIEWVWKKKNYSFIVMFDRETQFTFHFWRRLCEKIDTKSKLSTAWHSKIDDQIENANANFKVYLKVYVNYNQDDWVDFLSFVEFEVNSIKSNSIELKSFLATKDYLFKSELESSKLVTKNAETRKKMRKADKLIDKIEIIKIHLRDELRWAQVMQEEYANRTRHSVSELKMNDMIMLNARFQKTTRFNKNLDYKNLKSFKIVKVVDNMIYELKFLEVMQDIFSVFHSWFLHLNDETFLKNQNDFDFESLKMNEDSVYYLNEIIDFRINRKFNDSATRTRDLLKYKIKWFDRQYRNVNITLIWQSYIDIDNASYAIVDFHHKYSQKKESHHTFKVLNDWISSE